MNRNSYKEKGTLYFTIFILIVLSFYGWQITYLIDRNNELVSLNHEILELNKNLEEYTIKVNEELEKLVDITKGVMEYNTKTFMQLEDFLRESEEIKLRTERLNEIFFVKTNK